ncbi:MAG: twin-arginine translocase subunit TatC [Desulfobacterales bacterium]|nr:twin-arginine translocase subunit TatC [Desulfobacterales bacterium]
MSKDDKMSLTDHLEELRDRLINCCVAVLIGFFVSYYFKETIFDILLKPLIAVMGKGEKIIFTSLPEAFMCYLKVSFLSGFMLSVPFILYQFWMFLAPGLYEKEKKILFPIVILSSFFFIGGSLFGYFVVFPFAFKFFLSFASDTIASLVSMNNYLSFAIKLLIAFGTVFEMPLIITCLAALGFIDHKFLARNRKYAILIIFIVAAILTPPDIMSQILMAIPLIGLYELSILGAFIFGKKNKDNIENNQDEKESSEANRKNLEKQKDEEFPRKKDSSG